MTSLAGETNLVSRYVLAVHTRPAPGAEDTYHHWYDTYHLDEVLRVPGFVRAERLALVRAEPVAGLADDSHLALFSVESPDIETTMAIFQEAQRSMDTPPCLDADSVSLSWWRSRVKVDAGVPDDTAVAATGPADAAVDGSAGDRLTARPSERESCRRAHMTAPPPAN